MAISLEYLAGFFDGEGCIHISKTHQLIISAAQNERAVLDEFKQRFGGNVAEMKAGAFHWQIWGKALDGFLSTITPLLIGKKAQAELAIAYRIVFEATYTAPRSGGLSQDAKAIREVYRVKMSELKNPHRKKDSQQGKGAIGRPRSVSFREDERD